MTFSFNKVTQFDDWAVHGTMTLKRVNSVTNEFKVFDGLYDFEMHKYKGRAVSKTKTFLRNRATNLGDFFARGTGVGTKYWIEYQGSVKP